MKRHKLFCEEVGELVGWERVLYRAKFKGNSGNGPVVVGEGTLSVECDRGEFQAGKWYYATFETAEDIVDKSL